MQFAGYEVNVSIIAFLTLSQPDRLCLFKGWDVPIEDAGKTASLHAEEGSLYRIWHTVLSEVFACSQHVFTRRQSGDTKAAAIVGSISRQRGNIESRDHLLYARVSLTEQIHANIWRRTAIIISNTSCNCAPAFAERIQPRLLTRIDARFDKIVLQFRGVRTRA